MVVRSFYSHELLVESQISWPCWPTSLYHYSVKGLANVLPTAMWVHAQRFKCFSSHLPFLFLCGQNTISSSLTCCGSLWGLLSASRHFLCPFPIQLRSAVQRGWVSMLKVMPSATYPHGVLHLVCKASKISTGYFDLPLAWTPQGDWMKGK